MYGLVEPLEVKRDGDETETRQDAMREVGQSWLIASGVIYQEVHVCMYSLTPSTLSSDLLFLFLSLLPLSLSLFVFFLEGAISWIVGCSTLGLNHQCTSRYYAHSRINSIIISIPLRLSKNNL